MTALAVEISGKGKGGGVEWGNVWREIRLDKSVIVGRENKSGAGRESILHLHSTRRGRDEVGNWVLPRETHPFSKEI